MEISKSNSCRHTYINLSSKKNKTNSLSHVSSTYRNLLFPKDIEQLDDFDINKKILKPSFIPYNHKLKNANKNYNDSATHSYAGTFKKSNDYSNEVAKSFSQIKKFKILTQNSSPYKNNLKTQIDYFVTSIKAPKVAQIKLDLKQRVYENLKLKWESEGKNLENEQASIEEIKSSSEIPYISNNNIRKIAKANISPYIKYKLDVEDLSPIKKSEKTKSLFIKLQEKFPEISNFNLGTNIEDEFNEEFYKKIENNDLLKNYINEIYDEDYTKLKRSDFKDILTENFEIHKNSSQKIFLMKKESMDNANTLMENNMKTKDEFNPSILKRELKNLQNLKFTHKIDFLNDLHKNIEFKVRSQDEEYSKCKDVFVQYKHNKLLENKNYTIASKLNLINNNPFFEINNKISFPQMIEDKKFLSNIYKINLQRMKDIQERNGNLNKNKK